MATVCGSCKAPVKWAINEGSGKREPLDVEPVDNGNIEIVGVSRRHEDHGVVETPVIRHLKKGEVDVLPGFEVPDRYVSHFATCPYAKRHRKG